MSDFIEQNREALEADVIVIADSGKCKNWRTNYHNNIKRIS